MQFIDFCSKYSQILSQEPSVILFISKNYSTLAFEKILRWLSLPSLQKLDFDADLSQIQMKLHTTFLGQTCTFWFGDLSFISSKKKRTDWLEFLQSYEGPHKIIGWLSQDDVCNFSNKKNIKIEVPEQIDREIVQKISVLYHEQKPEVIAYFLGRLYRNYKEFSLEQLCFLLQYCNFLGKNTDIFFDAWIEKFIISDVSLFYLAQLFFEKKADEFFAQWHKVRDHYSDQFWTVFFSEQLFKAYFYVHAQGRVDQSQKQMTYGLPFSFLKYDWKLYQTSTLQQAHEQLYQIDIALKNGGNSFMLDGFLAKYLAG